MADDGKPGRDKPVAMISSTSIDLPAHREQVFDACWRAGVWPEAMEIMPAQDADAVEASLALVDGAEVYIGIFAFRYGTVPEGSDISITEQEYDRAVARGLPRLIFFMHEDHPVKPADVETGPGAEKLKALKEKIGTQRVGGFFKSDEDLRTLVLHALQAWQKERQKTGPDQTTRQIEALHRSLSIPKPPEAFIAHPYTLRQTDLVGRQGELGVLTDWVANPRSAFGGAVIFAYIAIGGMGKSALTWHWFNKIAPQEMSPLDGRMWWSFYESDADFEAFTVNALAYLEGMDEAEIRDLPWPDRERRLLSALQTNRVLMVLDGLERILRAYTHIDASRTTDEDLDARTGHAPLMDPDLEEEEAKAALGRHELRQCADPRADRFFQKLAALAASGGQARVLVTSRLLPTALQTRTGGTIPGTEAVFLRGLTDDDAVALWRRLGATGAAAELRTVFNPVRNHPLLIQALASEVAEYRKAPGDFAQWRAAHPDFDPAQLPLIQARSHILDFALKGLTEQEIKVLTLMVAFRKPAAYETLEAVLVGDGKACGTPADLDRVLTGLEARGLIGWDRGANRYDAHPIVRGVVWQRTEEMARGSVHGALEAHFQPMAKAVPDYRQVESLADLTPAIELFHALADQGRLDDAWTVFRDRLENATLHRLAAHRERIALLERLCPDGAEAGPALKTVRARAWTLNALGSSYDLSGQPGRALPLYRQTVALDDQARDENNLSVGLRNLAEAARKAGSWQEGLVALTRALPLTRKTGNRLNEALTLASLGQHLALSGQEEDAAVALGRSLAMVRAQGEKAWEGRCQAVRAKAALLADAPERAAPLADRAADLAQVERSEHDIIRATLLQGQAALALGDQSKAEPFLTTALNRARAVSLVEFELPALMALAALRHAQGNTAEARALLDQVWDPAAEGPYPRWEADAANLLAQIEQDAGNRDAAIAAASRAYTKAWLEGPPYAYSPGLNTARAHLQALGAPEPVLQPSAHGPFPSVDINPKDKNWVDPATVHDIDVDLPGS